MPVVAQQRKRGCGHAVPCKRQYREKIARKNCKKNSAVANTQPPPAGVQSMTFLSYRDTYSSSEHSSSFAPLLLSKYSSLAISPW